MPTQPTEPVASGAATLSTSLLLLTAVLVAVVGTALAWRWLRTGAYRRDDEVTPLPGHRWVLVAIPLLTAALAWTAREEPWGAATAATLLAPVGVALVAVDADVHRLPNALTLPFAPVVVLLLLVGAAQGGQWDDLRRALVALVVLGGGMVTFCLLAGSRGFGMGDAKLVLGLAPLLGWYGWSAVLVGLYGALLLGGAVALALVVTRRAERGTHLAFGPYLVIASVVAVAISA